MSLTVVLDALALPANAKVEQRIPKNLLVEQGAPTATDKRQIQDGVDELQWVAALKPTNIAVPAFHDAEREYLELAVVTVAFRENARVTRITELIHRAIPYPVFLVSSFRDRSFDYFAISVAHKRFAQNEVGKFVIDEILTTDPLSLSPVRPEVTKSFLNSLALSRLPNRDLFHFYQGWMNSLVGLAVGNITGCFKLPESTEQAHRMRDFTKVHYQTKYELSVLRKLASNERHLNRLVELNAKIKILEHIISKKEFLQ